jgi:hypothetical protein
LKPDSARMRSFFEFGALSPGPDSAAIVVLTASLISRFAPDRRVSTGLTPTKREWGWNRVSGP